MATIGILPDESTQGMNQSNPTHFHRLHRWSEVKMSNCKANESLQTKSLHLPTHMWIVGGIETCLPLLHNYCIYVCYVSIRCFNWCWTFKITMCRLVARAGALPRIHGGNTTARLVVGWDFQLSFENHLNWAFLRNFWRIRPLHSAQGYGRHNVSTRCSAFFPSAKGQIWESKISTDLRILDHHISQNQIYKVFYSCSLLLCFPNLLLIPTFHHWITDVSLKSSLTFREGAGPFFWATFFHQFWAQLPDPVQQGDSWGSPNAQGQAKSSKNIENGLYWKRSLKEFCLTFVLI